MKKWDLLKLESREFTFLIESTDPEEVNYFYQLLVTRFGETRDTLTSQYTAKYFSADHFTARSYPEIDIKGRIYQTDLFYELVIEARQRGWQPFSDFTHFIRYQDE